MTPGVSPARKDAAFFCRQGAGVPSVMGMPARALGLCSVRITSAVSVPQERAGYSAVQGRPGVGADHAVGGQAVGLLEAAHGAGGLAAEPPVGVQGRALAVELALGALDRRARLAALDGDAGVAPVEIGRAACRERGCAGGVDATVT